jgi:osmotically-inducible protein OsmY
VQANIQQVFRGDSDLRTIEVSVNGTEVTLGGRVPTFWVKAQAIKKALAVAGVESVVSELDIPAREDDRELAQEVGRAVSRYPYYTLWDYVDGAVNQGVVTLIGSVTPDRDKAGELFERVAKIRGVQDVRSSVETQPASSFDADIRSAIGSKLFNSLDFKEYSTRSNPPFHIIVDHSVVRLVGEVRSAVERRRVEQLVGQVQGVLRVVNDLQER